ncbi:MAG: HDOD domain-containing protein [Anaerolineales bacterium]|nr:HDOD domain-containing protein [Anaerolineales bacterium]
MTQPDSSIANSRRLNEILRSITRLRPLPTSTNRILRALDEPQTTAGLVAELIALDQALTAYTLRVANSAALGYTSSCASIKDAVMRLGFRQVRSLVVSTVASGPLSSRLSGYRLGDKGLWNHSISVASAAHWLAGTLRFPDPEKAYVAGLLHDIGKLVLDQYVFADYNDMVNLMHRHNASMWEVEKHLFGVDHAEVGGMITSHWQFPEELVDSIRYHHTPGKSQLNQKISAIVNLANALVPPDNPNTQNMELEGRVIHPHTLQILNIPEHLLESLQSRLIDAMFVYEARMPSM